MMKRTTKDTPKKAAKKPTPQRTAKSGKAQEPPIEPAFAPIVAAFANDRDVLRKRMFSSSNVLSVKGKIFAMLVKGQFVAKLPKERVDAIVGAKKGTYFDPGHGRLMKEWVALRPGQGNWVELAREAHVFVKKSKG